MTLKSWEAVGVINLYKKRSKMVSLENSQEVCLGWISLEAETGARICVQVICLGDDPKKCHLRSGGVRQGWEGNQCAGYYLRKLEVSLAGEPLGYSVVYSCLKLLRRGNHFTHPLYIISLLLLEM